MQQNKKQIYTNDKFTLVLFVIYTIFYESLVWGLAASAIYFLNWGPFTLLFALFVSSCKLKYKSFYVKSKQSDDLSESSDSDINLDLNKH